jgi:hypothetical protein
VRKWMIGIIAAVLTVVGGGYIYTGYASGDFCRLDGNNVCYDANNEVFKVEDRSKITIALPSKAMQDWFLDQFYLDTSRSYRKFRLSNHRKSVGSTGIGFGCGYFLYRYTSGSIAF